MTDIETTTPSAVEQTQPAPQKKAGVSGAFWKSLIITSIIAAVVLAVCIVSCVSTGGDDVGGSIIASVVLCVLLYLTALQAVWDTEPISTLFFDFACKKATFGFGLIFELSLDGILWLICVKLILFLLSAILTALIFILGVTLCMICAPFSFPFALVHAIREYGHEKL